MSDLAYADDIVILSSSYNEVQGLLGAVNPHAVAVGMCINASKTKVMSALVLDEQRQAVLLDGEPLEDVENSSTLARCSWQTARAPRRSEAGLIFLVPHSLAYNPVFGRGVKYLCAQRQWYGCETCPVRVADQRMLEVFDNDSVRRILRVRRRECVSSVKLRRLSLTSIPALVVQRRLRWFGHAARRPEGEVIKDLLLPTPPRT